MGVISFGGAVLGSADRQWLVEPIAQGTLRVLVNVGVNVGTAYAAYVNNNSKELLFTDVSRDTVVFPTTPPAIADAIIYCTGLSSNPVVGTYLSSSYVKSGANLFDPKNRLASTLFTSGQLRAGDDGNNLVEYTQAGARQRLVNNILSELITRRTDYSVSLVHLDNWNHPAADPGFFATWAQTLTYLEQLYAALRPAGFKLIVDLFVPVGHDSVGTSDLADAANFCDGIMLEQPADNASQAPATVQAIMTNATRLGNWITTYQNVLQKRCAVLMLPNTIYGDATLAASADFLAGLAMVLYGPMVSWPYYSATQRWHRWYADFGLPTGDLVRTNLVLSRTFKNGTISVDCNARTTTATLT